MAATEIYLIRRLYNVRRKESDLVQAHLNEYESINSHMLAQEIIIDDELKALLLMGNLPPSYPWDCKCMSV